MIKGRWGRIGAWWLGAALACASTGAAAASQYYVTVNGTPGTITCTDTGFSFSSSVSLQWQLKSETSVISTSAYINGALVGTNTYAPGVSGSYAIGGPTQQPYPSTPFPYSVRIDAIPEDSYTDGVRATFDCPSASGTNWTVVTLPPKIPVFSASPSPVVFASTEVGASSVEQVVTITNTGGADATMVSMANSNGVEFQLTQNTCPGAPLAKGAACTLTATFRPTTAGNRNANVQIGDEGGATNALLMRGTATGGPVLALPPSVAFGSQTVGTTSAPNNVTVTNTGTTTANVSAVTSNNAAEFPVTTTCAVVAAGATCTIALSFTPAAAGARSATITVASDGAGNPQKFNVTGTGVAAGGAGQLALPGPVTFAAQAVGTTSAPQGATLTNVGGAPVTVASVVSSNAAEFPVTSACATVAAGATCELSLTFSPAAAGARSATITVTSNGTGSPQTLAVSGTGAAGPAPGQLALAAEVNFGGVQIGTTTAPAPVAVTNVGGTAVAVASVGSSNPSEFAVASSTCGSVAAGASCEFALTFAPAAQGAREATITVVSNGTGSPQSLLATGTGVTGPPPPPPTADAIEYYHAEWDHYFVTSIADEISKLDAGVFKGWARTGLKFKTYALNTAGSVNVCRFFSTSFGLLSSHFYTPFAGECAIVKANPDWQFEGDVFGIPIPDANGACPAGTVPVYRLYNNGQGGAPNHRYTTDPDVRAQMIARGWIPEGYGPLGVIMCAPA
ncbi:MAG: choice-of-anchor D domain-containing protein [Betaproteobacteria bacterium]|nr:choice-of-anchor D domain-containing protein [Betaproteobacteria bacterium]